MGLLIGNAKRNNKWSYTVLVAGLCIVLSPLHAVAAASQSAQQSAQVEFGSNGVMVDTTQLDQFNAAQDARAVKYIELDENHNLITSDVPIRHIYMASKLKDLGYTIQAQYAGTKDFVGKSSKFTLTDARLQQMPVIPEFVMSPNAEYQPAATAYASAASTAKAQMMAPAAKAAHNAARSRPAAVSSAKPLHNMSAQTLEIALGLAAVYILFLLAFRTRKQKRSTAEYKGELGAANELVGRGVIFDFSSNQANHLVFPSNRSNLHLMWHIKRFTDDSQNGVHTYFYMTFYVPTQQGYAANLQKKKSTSKRKEEILS